MVTRRTRPWLVAACLVGGACSPDQDGVPRRLSGYATVHDTMPEAIHRAKHRAVERPPAEVARSRSVEARDSRLTRIAGTPDAWLDVALHRRTDDAFAATADTLDLLMNCNADSLVVFTAAGEGITAPLVLAPGTTLGFAEGAHRIRIFGLRSVKRGQRSETQIRTALGGDLVVRTAVDE